MRLWETAIQFPKCHSIRLEARAEISGPPIRYLTPGSALRLQCRVVQNTEASEYIFWYHDNRMINYDIDRGINVSTEPGKSAPLPPSPLQPQLNLTTPHCILALRSFSVSLADFQSSELTIQRTRREHSGNFTCVASNTQPASVLVHIFKGECDTNTSNRVIRLPTLRILAACQRGHLKYCALVNCSDQIKEKKGKWGVD